MTLTDTQLTIVLAALPGIIIALGSWWNIKGHVNSMNTTLSNRLATANLRISDQEKVISDMVQAREVKAATEIVSAAAAAMPPSKEKPK